jgi:hypothetical protein
MDSKSMPAVKLWTSSIPTGTCRLRIVRLTGQGSIRANGRDSRKQTSERRSIIWAIDSYARMPAQVVNAKGRCHSLSAGKKLRSSRLVDRSCGS